MSLDPKRAMVLFSGGQDSTVCLVWSLLRFSTVETIGFDYGQRHGIELECRNRIRERLVREFPAWGKLLGEDHFLDLRFIKSMGKTAMTDEVGIEVTDSGLPSTFVPGRNLLFFTTAAGLAYRRGTKHLIGGMCETDYSGYPDCRDDTLKSLQSTLNLGMDSRFVVHTPLMWIDKAQTWELAHELGGQRLVNLIREETHSCYLGERDTLHEWGYGCAQCPACELRATGYEKYVGSVDGRQ